MNPFFSIIIPSYNRGHVIRRAIDSVVNQSFQEFEIIVVDDGSSDNTRQLVESLPHKEKIFYVRQENKGASAARNLGASKAKGDYLIFLDSDDYLGEIALAGYFNVLHSGPFKLAMGYSIYVNGAGKLLSRVHPWKDETSFRHPLSGSFAVDHRTFTGLGGY